MTTHNNHTIQLPKAIEHILIALALIIIPCISSCKDDDGGSNSPDPTSEDALFITSSSTIALADGSQQIEATFTSTGKPTVTPSADWLTITEFKDNGDGYYSLTATAAANTTSNNRDATISITCGTATISIPVSQKGVTTPTADDTSIIERMGMGWNLGNQFDSYNNEVASQTAWGNKAVTQATMDALKAIGIKTIRIPVTWLGHVGNAPSYTIDADWLNEVEQAVTFAENAGLNVIINIHHDGANSEHWLNIKTAATSSATNKDIKAKLSAMWTQIANKFSTKGDFLIFESMNEIHDGGWGWGTNRTDGGKQYATFNEWQQVFVDAVRATGGNNATRWLGIPGYCTNPDLTIEYLDLPSDPANRLMVAVHDYDPYEFTLNDKYNAWGHLADKSKGDTTNGSDEEKTITDTFAKLKKKFIDTGTPVYIGEMGCVRRASQRSENFRKYYLEYFCKAAKTYGLAPIIWDNGSTGTGQEQSGMIDHATGAFLNDGEELFTIMVNAVNNNDASYTLESVYNNAKIE